MKHQSDMAEGPEAFTRFTAAMRKIMSVSKEAGFSAAKRSTKQKPRSTHASAGLSQSKDSSLVLSRYASAATSFSWVSSAEAWAA